MRRLHIDITIKHMNGDRIYMAIKIYIDQGHNPRNPNAGAEGNGLREQDITYSVGVLLARLFRRNGNFEVRLSRNLPDEIIGTSNSESLRTRVNEANDWGADYFISLHTNASTNPNASGSEAFVFRSGSSAYYWAEDILRGLARTTGLRNRGVMSRPGLYVLRKTRMPAVLVELGFITNPADASLMDNEPELFARGIYEGTLQFINE